LYCGWLISPISLMNQDDDTTPEIGDDNSAETGELTWSSDIEEDYMDHQQEILHLGQLHRGKRLHTMRAPLPKKRSRANTVIARPLLQTSQSLPVAMAPPPLKCQKLSLLYTSSESDHAPSTQALVLPKKSSGDQNIPQPKASSDQSLTSASRRTRPRHWCFQRSQVETRIFHNPRPVVIKTLHLQVVEHGSLCAMIMS